MCGANAADRRWEAQGGVISARDVPGLTEAQDDVGRPFGWLARVLGEERRFANRADALRWMATEWSAICERHGVNVIVDSFDPETLDAAFVRMVHKHFASV